MRRWDLPKPKKKFNAELAEGRTGPGGPRVALLKPQTFMNDAGRAVGPARGSYRVELDRVLVIHDEIDLPFGDIRVRLGGGLAGHNGLKSLRRELGSPDFHRVRVGVGRPDSTDPEIVSSHVLGSWRQPADEVAALVAEAADAAERLVTELTPRDWNAESYQRVSAPLEAMGREVLDRLELHGDERVLDAGCGTGRVTAALLERLPRGEVVAVDGSPAMVEEARERLGPRADVRVADLTELVVDAPVDAILSTATFHWIADHDRLFERLFAALKPGGRLVAQCGGEGNVAAVQAAIDRVAEPSLAGWDGPWHFASPAATAERLERIGFTEVRDVAAARARGARGPARVPRHRDARLAPRARAARAPRRLRRRGARGDARARDRVRAAQPARAAPAL